MFTAAQARASDAWVMNTLGLPGLVMMENAGLAVVYAIRHTLAARPLALADADVVVVCGAGQNGGDGFVIARHLALGGAKVRVVTALPAAKIRGDAERNLQVLRGLSHVPVRDAGHELDRQVWQDLLGQPDVIVDAVFGTGLNADVQGAPAAAIAAMNACQALRVSVDVPSGLDADSGRQRGVAVRADLTVTMAARKLGFCVNPDAPVGDVVVAQLGAPAFVPPEGGPVAEWLEAAFVSQLVPRFGAGSHKGSRGHLLVIAGAPGTTGAAALCGLAGLRAGAGLVTVASTRKAQNGLDAKLAEVMSAVYAEGEDADGDSFDLVVQLSRRMKAVALGPGIPTGPGTKVLVQRLARELTLPTVIDADGLNHLGTEVAFLKEAAAPRVLTPHPGEMARLLGVTTAEVQGDRVAAARALVDKSGAVVVLKGARTLIATPLGELFINPAATAALGTAGSGDVLTGTLGALLAQGLSARDAAICGVFAHGEAALAASERLGTDRLVAGDLPLSIAQRLSSLGGARPHAG